MENGLEMVGKTKCIDERIRKMGKRGLRVAGLMVLVFLLVVLSGGSVLAEETTFTDSTGMWSGTITDTANHKVTLTQYQGSSSNVTIPDKVTIENQDYSVALEYLGDRNDQNKQQGCIQSLTIESGVNLSAGLNLNMPKLESLSVENNGTLSLSNPWRLPDTVTSINFMGCANVKEITSLSSLTKLSSVNLEGTGVTDENRCEYLWQVISNPINDGIKVKQSLSFTYPSGILKGADNVTLTSDNQSMLTAEVISGQGLVTGVKLTANYNGNIYLHFSFNGISRYRHINITGTAFTTGDGFSGEIQQDKDGNPYAMINKYEGPGTDSKGDVSIPAIVTVDNKTYAVRRLYEFTCKVTQNQSPGTLTVPSSVDLGSHNNNVDSLFRSSTDGSMGFITLAIENNDSLTSIPFSWTWYFVKDEKQSDGSIKNSCSIQNLDVKGCKNLTDIGGLAYFMKNDTLQSVDLDGTGVTDDTRLGLIHQNPPNNNMPESMDMNSTASYVFPKGLFNMDGLMMAVSDDTMGSVVLTSADGWCTGYTIKTKENTGSLLLSMYYKDSSTVWHYVTINGTDAVSDDGLFNVTLKAGMDEKGNHVQVATINSLTEKGKTPEDGVLTIPSTVTVKGTNVKVNEIMSLTDDGVNKISSIVIADGFTGDANYPADRSFSFSGLTSMTIPSAMIGSLTLICDSLPGITINGSESALSGFGVYNKSEPASCDWSAVSKMKSLRSLGLSAAGLKAVPDLSGISELHTLNFGNNAGLTDISNIGLPTNLNFLYLNGCAKLSDVSALKNYKNYQYINTIDIDNTAVTAEDRWELIIKSFGDGIGVQRDQYALVTVPQVRGLIEAGTFTLTEKKTSGLISINDGDSSLYKGYKTIQGLKIGKTTLVASYEQDGKVVGSCEVPCTVQTYNHTDGFEVETDFGSFIGEIKTDANGHPYALISTYNYDNTKIQQMSIFQQS